MTAVLASRDQATDALAPHAAECHRAHWFVAPGHVLRKEQMGNGINAHAAPEPVCDDGPVKYDHWLGNGKTFLPLLIAHFHSRKDPAGS
jgi:hypothetical protein